MTFENQFRGLIPALDRRQLVDKFILDGQNFLLDAEGPFSAFGSQLVTYEKIRSPEFAQTFRVGAKLFLLTIDAIFEFDENSHLYFPRFIFSTPADAIFPWSTALVGGKFYFVKKGVNVIEYAPLTEIFTELTADVVGVAYAVTQSGGRLIIFTDVQTQWSAIDDGDDLAIDPDKKVGGQLNAIIGGGTPLGVYQTFDGFIAYTTTGLLKFTIITAALPFRVDTLIGSELVPISPYAIIATENDEHIYLAKTGFFITSGKKPEPFQQLMGEYLRRKVLPLFDLTLPAIFRLSYNADRQWFILSIAEGEQNYKYSKAYVLYLPKGDDGWGVFNEEHTGFGELTLTQGPFMGFNFGFFDFNGGLHHFVNFPHIEQHPDGLDGAKLPSNFHLFHESLDIPSRIVNGVTIFATHGQLATIDEGQFTLGSDLYEYTGVAEHISPQTVVEVHQASIIGTPNLMITDTWGQFAIIEMNWKQYTPIFGSINSFIDIGLFRFAVDETEAAEMSLITEIIIGMLDDPAEEEFEDWLTFTPETNEDWLNDDLPDEDWGIDIFTFTNYKATIIGSLDGYRQFANQSQILEERTDVVDEESDTTGRSKYFTCYNNGVYHIIRIEALAVEQSFHLKVIDIEPKPAGVV